MIKNKKAQIMSLDILFTVTLVVLMFFLLFNIVEARLYQANIDKANNELDAIGFLAFDKIINNPLLNCYAYDTNNNFTIPACVSLSQSAITKKTLGIPQGYKCNLTGAVFTTNECNDVFIPADNSSYFSLDFNVTVAANKAISKKDYIENYMNIQNTLATQRTLTLRVWK